MRSLVLSALAGIAALTAVAAAPLEAKAGVAVGIETGATPVQWAPDWDDGPRYRRPPPPRHWDRSPPPYGVYRPYRPAYVEPECWRERRWVDTPWGPEMRHVRVCR